MVLDHNRLSDMVLEIPTLQLNFYADQTIQRRRQNFQNGKLKLSLERLLI